MFSLIPFPYKLLAGAALIIGIFFYGYTRDLLMLKRNLLDMLLKLMHKSQSLKKRILKFQIKYKLNMLIELTQLERKNMYIATSLKTLFLVSTICLTAGCTRTMLVPLPVMPTPPELLMRPPQELKTIRSSSPSSPTTQPACKIINNLLVCNDGSTTVRPQ